MRQTKAMIGYMRMTKQAWYRAGGFAETRCVRVSRKGKKEVDAYLANPSCSREYDYRIVRRELHEIVEETK